MEYRLVSSDQSERQGHQQFAGTELWSGWVIDGKRDSLSAFGSFRMLYHAAQNGITGTRIARLHRGL